MGSVHDVVPARGEHAAFLAGLTTVILWGSAFVAIRAAGVMLSPGPIALGRLTVSSAILTAVALLRRERLPARSAWLPIAVFGVLFLGGYSWAWLGERPSLLAVAGGGLCLSGVCAARRRSSAGNRAGSARAIRRTASSICRSRSGAKDSRRQGRGSPEKA